MSARAREYAAYPAGMLKDIRTPSCNSSRISTDISRREI